MVAVQPHLQSISAIQATSEHKFGDEKSSSPAKPPDFPRLPMNFGNGLKFSAEPRSVSALRFNSWFQHLLAERSRQLKCCSAFLDQRMPSRSFNARPVLERAGPSLSPNQPVDSASDRGWGRGLASSPVAARDQLCDPIRLPARERALGRAPTADPSPRGNVSAKVQSGGAARETCGARRKSPLPLWFLH